MVTKVVSVIQDCFSFAVGHPRFSRAMLSLLGFTLNSHWLVVIFPLLSLAKAVTSYLIEVFNCSDEGLPLETSAFFFLIFYFFIYFYLNTVKKYISHTLEYLKLKLYTITLKVVFRECRALECH